MEKENKRLPVIREMILHEDEDCLVIQKPASLLSIPDREGKEISLKDILIREYGSIYTVHRLDRETSGLILFAKNSEAHRHYSQQFEGRQAEKIYFGLVCGTPMMPEGEINAPIAEHQQKKGTMVIARRGKEALTSYQVEEKFRNYSWVRFQIHTGRTHQVRIHAKHLGHPIACDQLYGDGKPIFLSQIKRDYKLGKKVEEERPLLQRLALHAGSLSLQKPSGEWLTLEAPLPRDLRALLNQLGKS